MRAARSWAGVLIAGLLAGASASAGVDRVKPAPRERTFAFEMRAKPWTAIIEWLTDQTGLPFISAYPPPPGTFNFIAKKGQRYSLGELIDLLNDGLAAHKHVLLRGPTAFRIVPADQRIDKSLVPHIGVHELPQRGESEIVELMLPLSLLSAEDYAGDVKKLLGQFGEVVVLKQGNRLVVHDSARNLRRIVALTKEIEEATTRVIQVDGYPAPAVAEMLRRILKDTGGHAVDVKLLGR